MAKLTLPIPSPVPLDVLGKRIDVILDRVHEDSPWASSIITRLAGVCQNHGIETVWTLAIYQSLRFGKFKNAGSGTVALAEETLENVRCTFNAVPQLRGVLESVAKSVRVRGLRHIDFPEVLMALAGIGDWAKEPAIIAALAEHGLRPGMPLEELFVHGSAPVEPKKLTVVEEITAFGVLQAADVLPTECMEHLPSGITMLEVMMILAVSEDWFGWASVARDRFVEAVRKHLSSEALAKIEILNT